MKNKLELIKEMNDIIKNTTYTETNKLPLRDNAGYKKYGNNWATVVSVDIRNFKVFTKKFKNEYVVKMLQCFTKFLAEAAKDDQFSEYFRDIYFAGDEVIVVFEASTRGGINKAFDYACYANSIANYVLNSVLKENKYNDWDFKCGIGIWTSNDNTLSMVGHKYSSEDTTTTLIGSAINWSSYLAKLANKDGKKVILMNDLTKDNLLNQNKIGVDKHAIQYPNINGSSIYGCNFYYSDYV